MHIVEVDGGFVELRTAQARMFAMSCTTGKRRTSRGESRAVDESEHSKIFS